MGDDLVAAGPSLEKEGCVIYVHRHINSVFKKLRQITSYSHNITVITALSIITHTHTIAIKKRLAATKMKIVWMGFQYNTGNDMEFREWNSSM